jgi:protein gp37
MSDLFHEKVPDDYITEVAKVMLLSRWHTFQVLTKRSSRMRDLLETKLAFAAKERHIWWGVSVEDKKDGLPRLEHLRACKVAIKFISIEPLLEDLGRINLSGISWVIVGGESGHRARRMDKPWVLSVRNQCRKAKVPFFFKQWGGLRKKENGRSLDGKLFDEFPACSSLSPALDKATRMGLVTDLEKNVVPRFL